MSGRTATGLLLLAVGVAAALWGINLMNSLGSQIARQIGMQDNTAPLAIGVGVVFGLIGLVLLGTKGSATKS